MSETVESLKPRFIELGIEKVRVGGFDVDGKLHQDSIALEPFWSALRRGFDFPGWRPGEPTTHAKIDPSTFRVSPEEPRVASFLVSFCGPDRKNAHPACPRFLLRRVVARAEAAGFHPFFGGSSDLLEVADEAARAGHGLAEDQGDRISLFDVEGGLDLLRDEQAPSGRSLLGERFLAGQRALLPSMAARSAAAEPNPYLVMATSLASGLYGIERALDLPSPEMERDAAREALGEASFEALFEAPKRA